MPAPGEFGVTLGSLDLTATDTSGVTYGAKTLEGWGTPATTLSPQQRPRSHGAWSGESWLRSRTVVIGGMLYGADPGSVSAAVDVLLAACSLDAVPLTVFEAGRSRSCLVRQQDEIHVSWYSSTIVNWSLQVVADDPRKYGASQSVSTALPSASGGLTLPVTVPFTINASSVTGLVSIFNEGNIAAPIVVRFDGPVSGPRIVHVQTQRAWAASGAVLGAGEFWSVDMASRRVMAQGQSSRSGYITERGWMELLPGANDFAFSAASYNAASLMTVTAASAWK